MNWSFIVDNRSWLFDGIGAIAFSGFVGVLYKTFIEKKNKNSTNQIISYSEVRAIAMDVFKINFYELGNSANEIVQKRAEEILTNFLGKLNTVAPELLKNTTDPDFRYVFFDAQKAYARTGDTLTKEILVDVLVERLSVNNHSFLQIVLDEALSTIPKLTEDQYSTLSIAFILNFTTFNEARGPKALEKYLEDEIYPFLPNLSKETSRFLHIEYTSCGIISIAGRKIEKLFLDHYAGLFSKGFSESDICEDIKDEINPMLMPNFYDDKLLQVGTLNDQETKHYCSSHGLSNETSKKIIELQNSHLMSEIEVRSFLLKYFPKMQILYDCWDNSNLQQLRLTSVGIALAIVNIRRITKREYDLSLWIK